MKIAILLCGHIRSWNKEQFIQTFQNVDIFVHTYNNVFGYHPFIQNQTGISNNNIKLTNTEIESYIGITTKNIVIEDQDDIFINDTNTPIHADTYAQYRKFKLCNELRTQYESIHNIKYDLVIKTRFDISYSLNIQQIIQLATNPNIIYISEGPSIYPCDQIFISSGNSISFLADILTSTYYHQGQKFSPHEWLNKQSCNIIKPMSGLITNIIRITNI